MEIIKQNPPLTSDSLYATCGLERNTILIVPVVLHKTAVILGDELLRKFTEINSLPINEKTGEMFDFNVVFCHIDSAYGGIDTQWIVVTKGKVFYSRGDSTT